MTLREALALWWNPTPERAMRALIDLTPRLTFRGTGRVIDFLVTYRRHWLDEPMPDEELEASE